MYAWPQTDPVNVSIAAINGSCLGEPVWVLLLENNEEDGHTTEVRHNGDNGSSSMCTLSTSIHCVPAPIAACLFRSFW